MMPDRRSLVERVAETLRRGVASGEWKEWLPQERNLSQSFGVSRNTLRAALVILRREGLVEPSRGRGYRIGTGAGRVSFVGEGSVGLLAPEPLARLRPALGLLIDELRVLLFRMGLNLEVHNGGRAYEAGTPRLLASHVARHPAACWILIRGNERVQRWFEREGIPCVISGSAYPGVGLPSVDVDLFAVGAHAAGRLLGMGHRRLLLVTEGRGAGQDACGLGFHEMIAKTPGASGESIHHASDVGEVRRLMRKTFGGPRRPTAILVANSYFYLTVSGVLQELGLRVPDDVSLICTDSDHFLPYMVPEASRYAFDHELFARKLAQKVRKIVQGEPLSRPHIRIFPLHRPGASIARAQ